MISFHMVENNPIAVKFCIVFPDYTEVCKFFSLQFSQYCEE